jgi:hypothetical protein
LILRGIGGLIRRRGLLIRRGWRGRIRIGLGLLGERRWRTQRQGQGESAKSEFREQIAFGAFLYWFLHMNCLLPCLFHAARPSLSRGPKSAPNQMKRTGAELPFNQYNTGNGK